MDMASCCGISALCRSLCLCPTKHTHVDKQNKEFFRREKRPKSWWVSEFPDCFQMSSNFTRWWGSFLCRNSLHLQAVVCGVVLPCQYSCQNFVVKAILLVFFFFTVFHIFCHWIEALSVGGNASYVIIFK